MDIIRLLLPWSIKKIIQWSSSDAQYCQLKKMYWTTLRTCLDYFLCNQQDDNHQHNNNHASSPPSSSSSTTTAKFDSLQSLLSLSIMHKLVPIALKVALNEYRMVTGTELDVEIQVQYLAKDCYCVLVDHLYHPPFDAVCDSLLSILSNDNNKQVVHIWYDLTVSTIRLLHKRLAMANPKRSFQLIVRPKTFVDLATICSRIFTRRTNTFDEMKTEGEDSHSKQKELSDLFFSFVCDACFSMEHHIDGFRSLKLSIPTFSDDGGEETKSFPMDISDGDNETKITKRAKSNFVCYQEGLLTVVQDLLSVSPGKKDDMETHKNDDSDTTTFSVIANMIPILLDAFLHQASKLQYQHTKQKNQKKLRSLGKIGQMQFRLVAIIIGHLLNRSMKSSKEDNEVVKLAAIDGLEASLKLLLKHNVYQPSVDSGDERAFLGFVGQATVTAMQYEKEEGGRCLSSNAKIEFSWRPRHFVAIRSYNYSSTAWYCTDKMFYFRSPGQFGRRRYSNITYKCGELFHYCHTNLRKIETPRLLLQVLWR